MKTKIQNLFTALAWLALPMLGHAQVNYAVSGNTAYVTNSPNASGNVVITNTYDGYPVTSIGDDVFESSGITSVIIPNSVTTIGFEAFAGCYSLTSVTIPDSVTSIGDGAFFKCYDLTSVTIPNSVTSIGDSAFLRCFSLTNITVNATNSYYASLDGVLFDKSLDTLIEFPVGLAGSYAIPNSVTSIGEEAFAFCPGLTSVTIPNSVTCIGNAAFYYCTSLTSVYFSGNAPSPTNDSTVFDLVPATVYYLPGTTGWGAMFDGLPTALWYLPNPQILNFEPGFGVQPGGFGFTISWATNASVVVEAATNLANPVWIPVSSNPLISGTNYFSDPQWTNYPERFYRVTSAFTVGGTLTGLAAGDTVVLQDNGGDDLTLTTNGTFTFATPFANGQSYSVTVSGTSFVYEETTCTVTNGNGTISGANVTNVAVQCTTTPLYTGNLDVDMYNAAVADGDANGGVPAVMLTENGGPFRVTAAEVWDNYSIDVARIYATQCIFTTVVGSTSCSSTTLPAGTRVIQFGGLLQCGDPSYGY